MEPKTCQIFFMQGSSLGFSVFKVSSYASLSISMCTFVCLYCGRCSIGFLPINHHMCVASGEDMAYEHVHHHSAGVHCGSVGSEVYRGLLGIPLRPHHDSAAAPPRPLQDFRGT